MLRRKPDLIFQEDTTSIQGFLLMVGGGGALCMPPFRVVWQDCSVSPWFPPTSNNLC